MPYGKLYRPERLNLGCGPSIIASKSQLLVVGCKGRCPSDFTIIHPGVLFPERVSPVENPCVSLHGCLSVSSCFSLLVGSLSGRIFCGSKPQRPSDRTNPKILFSAERDSHRPPAILRQFMRIKLCGISYTTNIFKYIIYLLKGHQYFLLHHLTH